jgi:GntR family transcriptional regulator, vanillate catabolism transcriptional regulator
MTPQLTRVLVQLRDLILKGEFQPGERLTEIPLAEKLGASRSPVRAALAELQREGLVETSQSGGYAMRRITALEIDDAIAVRGNLEGMSARLIAERGLTRQQAADFRACLSEGDKIIDKATLEIDDYIAYTQMNDRFHRCLCSASGNQALARAIDSVSSLPFAAASALVPSPASLDRSKRWLVIANFQHHCLVEAMEKGNGLRAQAVAEEHVNISRENLRYSLDRIETASQFMPALKLVARVD